MMQEITSMENKMIGCLSYDLFITSWDIMVYRLMNSLAHRHPYSYTDLRNNLA
jgi:hypothetical protein